MTDLDALLKQAEDSLAQISGKPASNECMEDEFAIHTAELVAAIKELRSDYARDLEALGQWHDAWMEEKDTNDALRGRIAVVVEACDQCIAANKTYNFDAIDSDLISLFDDTYRGSAALDPDEVRAALKEPQPLLHDKDEKHE